MKKKKQSDVFLSEIYYRCPETENGFPFSVEAFKKDFRLKLGRVTFLIGENGSGKSTILEGISYECGFNLLGGGVNNRYADEQQDSVFQGNLKLSWTQKTTHGFFMRAESLFNFAGYLESLNDHEAFSPYGGKSLNEQSHGEAFLSLFLNRFRKGLFILDEPEAALSPNRQLSFLSLLHQIVTESESQFLIATHSPIILSYPAARIFSIDHGFKQISYQETPQLQITKDFVNHPDRFLKDLLVSSGD